MIVQINKRESWYKEGVGSTIRIAVRAPRPPPPASREQTSLINDTSNRLQENSSLGLEAENVKINIMEPAMYNMSLEPARKRY